MMKGLGCVAIATLISIGTSRPAWSDAIPYVQRQKIEVQGQTIRVLHQHDWSSPKLRQLINQNQSIFSPANDFSSLTVFNRNGTPIFRQPVPALSHLWVSPDDRYIVGFSRIKLWNPYHLVIYSRQGQRLATKKLCGDVTFPCGGSVTNFLFWYDEQNPDIQLKELKNGNLLLSFNEYNWKRVSPPKRAQLELPIETVPQPSTDLSPQRVTPFEP